MIQIRAGDMSETERLKVALCQSIRSPGLNPQTIFLLLAKLLECEFAGDDEDTAARFSAFVEEPAPAGLGFKPADSLVKVIYDLKHPHEIPPYSNEEIIGRMARMRDRVKKLTLRYELPLSEPGELGRGRPKRLGNAKSNNGTTAPYILARLKRDRPALAEKVIAGEMSANAAAIQAGFRRKLTHFEQIVRWLPTLTHDEIEQLKRRLEND